LLMKDNKLADELLPSGRLLAAKSISAAYAQYLSSEPVELCPPAWGSPTRANYPDVLRTGLERLGELWRELSTCWLFYRPHPQLHSHTSLVEGCLDDTKILLILHDDEFKAPVAESRKYFRRT
jgi:hypothetical protein